jgi:hypothetical protein
MVFSTKSKKPYTPPEWAGTLLRAFFAVRKQHIIQVKPVEGSSPEERRKHPMSTTVEMPLKTESVEEIAVAQPIYRVSVQDTEEAPPKEVLPPEDWPNIDHIETEDDEPVDNILSEKQQRLLTESLYSSWDGPGEGRTFMVAANVGIFTSVSQPPVVPDVFISLDVKAPANFHEKYNRRTGIDPLEWGV